MNGAKSNDGFGWAEAHLFLSNPPRLLAPVGKRILAVRLNLKRP